MTLSKGDVIEAETENLDYLNKSTAEHDGYSIILGKKVEEGVYSIKITDVGHQSAYGEIVEGVDK